VPMPSAVVAAIQKVVARGYQGRERQKRSRDVALIEMLGKRRRMAPFPYLCLRSATSLVLRLQGRLSGLPKNRQKPG